MIELVVSADSSPQYYGYYLSGFEALYGSVRLKFGTADFPQLAGPRDGLAVVLPDGRRIFLSADDFSKINMEALDWCDAYGMINLDPANRALNGGEKLIALGPGFGVRWHGFLHAVSYVARACAAGGTRFAAWPARQKAYLKHQRERLPLAAYSHSPGEPDRLFFLASYWHSHPEANAMRVAIWTDLLALPNVKLEGGFVNAGTAVARDLQATHRYSMTESLEAVSASCVAINTPAVHGCLGWKLGEFLALGKAIVSLPVTYDVPGRRAFDQSIVIVDSPEDVVTAVQELSTNHVKRLRLEANARAYFDEYVRPDRAVRRLLPSPD